jgi:hypothetical protein
MQGSYGNHITKKKRWNMHSILIFPDLASRNAYIQVLKAVTSITPVGKGNTPSAHRAYYPESSGRFIVNTSSPEMQKRLGRHRVAIPVDVDDPTAAGKQAIEILDSLGFDASMDDQAEPEMPKGFMVFVSVPAFDGIILLFWPRNPDPEAVKAFRSSGEFGSWTEADEEIPIDSRPIRGNSGWY